MIKHVVIPINIIHFQSLKGILFFVIQTYLPGFVTLGEKIVLIAR